MAPHVPALSIQALFDQLGLFDHLLAVVAGMPRLFMVAQVAPFLAGSVVTGQLRMVLVFACYLPVHPVILGQLPKGSVFDLALLGHYGALVLKESLMGLVLGLLAGIAFWTVQSAGFLIDNQRGASMAEESDPMSGEQTSPTGAFLLQTMMYLFYASGAFLAFLGLLYASYEIWPVPSLAPLAWSIEVPLLFAGRVAWLMSHMVLLAGPIVVACLLADISLGLVNRFASQLNVYVLAMPVKSAVASLLLVLYFGALAARTPDLFAELAADLQRLQGLLP
ncbi:type III secretion system export apparatus subunit SctT [Nitratidesulfovibrio oxamicus]|uniref:type III secretion system export apparatus subunit SctT n=1 Tax=Nitratidesulfovibrio oxamicus TaxID=32016 RepID=UPI0018C84CB8|nr:type III secretion system export apparatus subunit SctT [Nitratidesulfovibrio oxamicus]